MQPSSKVSGSGYPVKVGVVYPAGQNRWLALFSIPFFFLRGLLLIPHLIILYVLSFVSLIAAWLNFWVVLFTGKSNKSLFAFVVGILRWQTRVSGYLYGLTDKYPPFDLDK